MEVLFLITALLLLITGVCDLHVAIGYYTFLRYTVFVSSIWFTCNVYTIKPESKLIGIAIFAILFNPITPIYLQKDIWKIIDIFTSIVFICSLSAYLMYKQEHISKNNTSLDEFENKK